MANQPQNEGVRMLDEFQCEAIPDPKFAETTAHRNGENEGMRVVEELVTDAGASNCSGNNLVSQAENQPIRTKKNRSWAIKLGSGGRCIPFCEDRAIVGIGWKMVDPVVTASGSREQLRQHVSEVCGWYETERARGIATGQLFRFTQECQIGDYVLYYDPAHKHVVFSRVLSEPLYRDFELDNDTDVFHYRRVEYPRQSVPILDLYGPLKGQLLGPRMSFWEIRPYDVVDTIAKGGSPTIAAAPDPELENAYQRLRDLVLKRIEVLNESDWEWLVVDYFKAQGAHVDERRVGGSHPIIDAEAIFDRGELGSEVWRIQVKRHQNRPVHWSAMQQDFEHVGDAKFCYVSVYGFTEEARKRAYEENVILLEAGNFTQFLLGGNYRDSIKQKLRLPDLGARIES